MSHFNTYMNEIDVVFLRNLCQTGSLVHYSKGDIFCSIGEMSDKIGYIVKGGFRYVAVSTSGKEYITGFAFQGAFVVDYPNCLYHSPSDVMIVAMEDTDVHVISSGQLIQAAKDTQQLERISNAMFSYLYKNYLDFYRLSPKERYQDLLNRCPQIIQDILLKELASYLKITPTYLSKIRRDILKEER